MDLRLSGRTALITGGGTGIGYGIAEALAVEGVRVILIGRRLQVLQTPKANSNRRCGRAARDFVRSGEPRGGQARCAKAIEQAGQVDILVNNAGTSEVLGIGADEARWSAAYALRVVAPRQLAEALLPGMRTRKFGRIINIGGTFEVQTLANSASVMNAARTVYFKSISHEVARDGVTVNTIGPGVIISEQINRIFPTQSERDAYCEKNIPDRLFWRAAGTWLRWLRSWPRHLPATSPESS